MQIITKYGPYILLLIALISLYFQWRTYQVAAADCGCSGNHGSTDQGTGPII